MTLTRKDFFLLAEETAKLLKKVRKKDIKEETKQEIEEAILNMVTYFCSCQNGLFDRRRFINKVEEDLNKFMSG